jgi:recombinational DNA repair ATPase RecF
MIAPDPMKPATKLPSFWIDAFELENIRCFANQRLEFGSGLNLIGGPNGSGKSTLVAALKMALWASNKSKADDALKIDANEPAKLRLSMRAQTVAGLQQISVHKTLSSKLGIRISHQVIGALSAPTVSEGQDAQIALLELIADAKVEQKYRDATRDHALKLIWVEQGDLQVPTPGGTQGESLRSALSQLHDAKAARFVLAAIDAELDTALDKRNGTPKADYKRLVDDAERAQKALAQLKPALAKLKSDREALQALNQQSEEFVHWNGEALALAQAQVLCDDLLRQTQALSLNQRNYAQQNAVLLAQAKELTRLELALLDLHRLRAEIAQLDSELQALESSMAALALTHSQAQKKHAEHKLAMDGAQVAQAQHNAELAQVRQQLLQLQRLDLQAAIRLTRDQTEAAKQVCEQIRGRKTIAHELQTSMQRLQLQQQQREALAPTVRLVSALDLSTVIDPQIDGAPMVPHKLYKLDQRAKIVLEPGLYLEFDLPQLTKDAFRQEARRALELSAQCFPIEAASEQKFASQRLFSEADLMTQLGEFLRMHTELIANLEQSFETALAALAASDERSKSLQRDLKQLAEMDHVGVIAEPIRRLSSDELRALESSLLQTIAQSPVAALTNKLRMAQESLQFVASKFEKAKVNVDKLRNAKDQAQSRLQRLRDLDAPDATVDLAQHLEGLLTLAREAQSEREAELAREKIALDQLAQAVSDRGVASLQQEIAQAQRRLAARQQARLELSVRMGQAEQELALKDPEELATIAQHAQHTLDSKRLRISALKQLQGTLQTEIAQFESQIEQPLLAIVQPLLPKLLAQDVSIKLDGDLAAQLLVFNQLASNLSMDALSIGTREQIAVLLRLAYAKVLSDAGSKVVVVLDDVLNYSDAERLRQFAAILCEFAQHFQILLLSCGWLRWRALFKELQTGTIKDIELKGA